MNLGRTQLYRIILEEYIREEGLDEGKVEDLLAWIKGGGEKPEWAHDDRPPPEPPDVPDSDTTRIRARPGPPDADLTYPMEPPKGRRAEMNQDELAATIGELIHGRDPEEVSEIFQMAFEKLPGVELSSPGDEDYPGEETLYARGAEGRPTAGFRLEELASLIKEVMSENEWYNITAGETAPSHSTGVVEPQELVQRIQNAYHDLQDAFEELPDEIAQELGRQIISDLETLMDTTEHPEDYRE